MRRRVVQWIDGFGIGDVAPEVGRRTDHIRFDYLGDPEIDAVGNGAGQRLLLDVAQVSESASGVEAIERPGEYRGVDDIRPDRLVLPVGSGTLLRVHARGPGQLPRQLTGERSLGRDEQLIDRGIGRRRVIRITAEARSRQVIIAPDGREGQQPEAGQQHAEAAKAIAAAATQQHGPDAQAIKHAEQQTDLERLDPELVGPEHR